jgi:DNA-directed RNA polymerase sigma subunit (sigma70/sigma32)
VIPANLHELSELEVAQLLRHLTADEKRIIRLRFGLNGTAPVTLTGASEATGLTREVVRQTELRAMERLGWVTLAK